MAKNVLKRFTSIILATLMVILMLPADLFQVYAASVNTGVTGLSAEYDSGTWSASGGTITGSVKTTSSSSCGSPSYTPATGTLTLKNTLDNEATLSFKVTTSLNSGTATIDGSNATNSFTKVLGSGESITVAISSNPDGEDTTTITLSEINLALPQNITVSFKKPVNGSYSVDGTSITEDTDITKLSTESFALNATPASGYKFAGWKGSVDGNISSEKNTEIVLTNSQTVEPIFISIDTAVFDVEGKIFYDLEEAIQYSVDSGKKLITLIENGTITGDYTIPSGKTLLIPFDEAKTIYKETPAVVYNSYTTPSAFRTLTMASGSSISIQSGGAISLSGKLSSKGQLGGNNGTPTGPDGRIKMLSGSSINVQSGGNLYAWGYIYGSGSVVAESGATVHEAFQIKDWRGGSATSNIYSYAFILSQYYVQNIEVPLTVYVGATEKLYSAANASGSAYTMGATFIGNNGLFKLSSGYLIKDYIESTDRLEVSANGNVSVSPMSLTGLPFIGSISTDDYELPVTSNITINMNSGTASVAQDIKLLPGVELNLAEGTELEIPSGRSVYMYDNDNWGNFTGSARLYVIGYSVANGTTTKRTAAGLKDAKINVNGTVNVSGDLYTSEGGADITSSNATGEVILTKAPAAGDVTIYEMENNSTKTAVTFTAAKLHNGCAEPEYTPTAGEAANTTFYYCKDCNSDGIWEKGHSVAQTYTVTWKNADGTVLETDVNVPAGQIPTYDGDTPVKEADAEHVYTFKGWDPEVAEATEDVTYTAVFAEEARKYTVTWQNADGTVLGTSEVAYGETPVYGGEEPVKKGDAQHSYTFSGWDPEVAAVTGDAAYTAQFTESVNTYTVTWENADGRVLETDADVPYGTTPSFDGEEPSKEATAQYTYTFDGWDPEIADVAGNVTYTAKYKSEVNKYTVTWKNEDGTELASGKVAYGTVPEYKGETPAKDDDAQYSYTFAGWTPEVVAVTGEATYTAEFTPTVKNYKVVWKDADGTVLETDESVAYGDRPSYDGKAPAKAADAQYTYTFDGWDPEVKTVTGDAEYTAKYSKTVNKYTVTWVGEDDSVLETDTDVEYGTTPSYDGATPSKEATAQYTYTFDGWTPDVEAVSGNVTYKATFKETVNKYKVTWKDEDGKVLRKGDVEYGSVPSYGDENPEKEADAQYTYYFAGWTPEVKAVTEDAEYTATYTTSTNKYTVIWKNYDGRELEKDNDVEYGETPEYNGTTPVKDGDAQYSYEFSGWEPSVSSVTGDVIYTAVFTQKVNKYTVKWLNDDGSVLSSEEYEYGAAPSYSGETPAKEADAQYTYTFKGWTPEIAEVTEDASYTAEYGKTVNKYTVTWISGGEIYATEEYEYGATPQHPAKDPVLDKNDHFVYTFTGWDPELSTVKEAQTYTAQFDKKVATYKVSFEANGGSGSMDPQEISYGETAKLKANEFTNEGYSFKEWNTKADGAGNSYSNEFEMAGGLTEDLTLYAQWMLEGWHKDDKGLTWYKDGVQVYFGTWATIDGNDYYFDADGYVATGLYKTTSKDGSHEATFIFDEETGKFMSDQSGIYEHGGDTYWTKDGEVVENAGLVRVEKEDDEINYYYFGEDSKAVKDGTYKVENNNGLRLPCAGYNFGPDGVIEHDPDTSKNGICNGDGSVFYYIDGVKVGVGLIQVNGSYYYARTSTGEIVRDRSYWITQTNGLPPAAGVYEFDKDGKMILNGWINDGSNTYYYVDGVRANDYYFFNKSSGKLYKDATLWVADNEEYGFTGGMYYFDADGKMVVPDMEHGQKKIVSDGGDLYLTIDGKRMTDGLYELDGEYYYAHSSGKLAVNKAVYASNKDEGVISALQAKKNYWLYFGEGGKMQKTGFVEGGGSTYYYNDCATTTTSSTRAAESFTKMLLCGLLTMKSMDLQAECITSAQTAEWNSNNSSKIKKKGTVR